MEQSNSNTKTLLDIFTRYRPNAKYENILNKASNISVRFNRELKMVEVSAFFPEIISKKVLYQIETEICQAHGVNSVIILPKYSSELFNMEYISEVLEEAKRVGVITRGFFSKYSTNAEIDKITIEILFSNGGIELLYDARTPTVISEIIESEFGLKYTVEIISDKEYFVDYDKYYLDQQNELNSSIPVKETKEAEVDSSQLPLQLEKFTSIYKEDVKNEAITDTIYEIGKMKFDISNSNLIFGNEFKINPTPLRNLTDPKRNIVILGEVFGFDKKNNRKGNKLILNFGITDNDTSINVKCIFENEKAEPIAHNVKDGCVLAVRGQVKLDVFDNELVFAPSDIAIIEKIPRKDNAVEKRVELHLHTNMSSMDATIPPDLIVKTAHAWGHKAVAITDHANVQAYPEAMLAAEKLGMKVIYGVEAYFVDDTARAIYGGNNSTFKDEFVVFDIETTGLSPLTCKITEIGAVLVCEGKVVDIFNTFVNPQIPIPYKITELTGITDKMVEDAPFVDHAVKSFLDFAGDRVLIAHNAGFDISFIRKAAEDYKLPFSNSYLDTVALSRYVNPDLKTHKLNTIAEYFKLGNFNHHRASDDAETLAKIFFAMVEKLKQEGIFSIEEMNSAMAEKADPLKLKTYHQIILVKNKIGLKNLYKIISKGYLDNFRKTPRVPKTLLAEMRDGLIIGSACEAGELFTAILENRPYADLLNIADFYDYLEIQPLCNNQFLIDTGRIADIEELMGINKTIIKVAKDKNIPVVATCDAHFLNEEDEIGRKILLNGLKYPDSDRDIKLFYRTTEEMLEEFKYLGKDIAYEVVITNTNLINDMIENIRPIPKGTYVPKMDGAEQDLQNMCWSKAKEMYGDPLPVQVESRLEKELTSIIKHGFAVLYMIAQKLIENSEKSGYLVGSRGSVGSSFTATMAGITEVNPLPPHYLCQDCKYSQFIDDGSVGSGYDLPDKICPLCGNNMLHDGHDIPFETFLGFYGDKSPDIDLNFSGDVQAEAHKYTEVLFGKENVYRAGTLGTLASKTSYGFVIKYLEGHGIKVNKAEMSRLINKCIGVKRTTGQHPGGIIVIPREYDIYDFTPVQHPADDANSGTITTHFAFEYLHDTILKLDILGHDVPTKYKILEKYTGINVKTVPMNDKNVMELFLSTKSLKITPQDINSEIGTFGLPECGTRFVRQMFIDTKPKYFSDLLQISGLSHGTDVWLGNAQDLIKNGICTISDVIGTRDNIMVYLIYHGLEKSIAFKIMEDVRKGKGLKAEYEEAMIENNIPEWYIESCKKIKYMFPKAHAAAYIIAAIRLAWYKVYKPLEFYAAYFTVAPSGFDGEIVMKGKSAIIKAISDIEAKGNEATQKENDTLTAMQIANEALARGYKFSHVSLYKSDAHAYIPEEGKIRLPFSSLSGLGDNAATKIMKVREEDKIFSIEELQQKAQLPKSVIEILQRNGVLEGLSATNQISFV